MYGSRWTDGFLEPKLSRSIWSDRENGIATYIGDKIEFQNGFGAWQPHVYSCDVDLGLKVVVDVSAAPGRLPG